MSMILYFSEYCMSWLTPVIVYILQRFIKPFYSDPFNNETFDDDCSFQNTSNIHMEDCTSSKITMYAETYAWKTDRIDYLMDVSENE